MRPPSPVRRAWLFATAALIAALATTAFADDKNKTEKAKDNDGWIVLLGSAGLDAWKSPTTNWETVGAVSLKSDNPKRLAATAGSGVAYNGPGGRAVNLVSRETFGDVEVHLEFNVPKGSNSGIKLEGVYEIQIYDSYGVKKLSGSDCGGVYPRAELLPKYHHIDEGYAPRTNATRPPGEWQTLDIVFHAPRFDVSGKKMANARFDKVELNGQVVQADRDVPTPTGNVWRNQEHLTGPILLQGDHGPVAFRNLRVRPLR
jgi:hypothetical protein